MPLKLHLGCGDTYISGYINVDIRDNLVCDMVADIGDLSEFEPSSVDVIYACHVLEHFKRHEYMYVLDRWHRLLKPNGILRVAVPDLFEVAKGIYLNQEKTEKYLGFLYGGQNYDTNYHYMGFTFKSLRDALEKVGFKDVRRYDWRETEHSHIDDYSQAYLPHMDKDNGNLMSLNIEAIKNV